MAKKYDNERDDETIDPVPNIETPGCWVAVVVMAAAAAVGATAAKYVGEWLEWLTR